MAEGRPVQTTYAAEKFENAAFFLRLGQPFILIRQENESLKNALQTEGI